MATRKLAVFVLILAAGASMLAATKKRMKPVVIGYVGGYRGLFDMNTIDPSKVTHLNYAFINVKDSMAFVDKPSADTVNLRNLYGLKKKNPDLKLLISVGGWSWSENFSDAALTATSRKLFARSAVDIIRKYKLDGVDVDWEYPSIAGEEGNVFRPADKQNFTLLMAALRAELDLFEKESGREKLLTVAVGGWAEFLQAVEMEKAQHYLDYINLMTYDFYNQVAGHHSNLYPSTSYADGGSADKAVKAYLAAGIKADKLVLGLPFYGKSVTVKTGGKGIGDTVISRGSGKSYTALKDQLIGKNGFEAYHDKQAEAPYLYNSRTGQLYFYDDERTIAEKCRYVLNKKIAGVMFWEFSDDDKGYLLNTIHKEFNK